MQSFCRLSISWYLISLLVVQVAGSDQTMSGHGDVRPKGSTQPDKPSGRRKRKRASKTHPKLTLDISAHPSNDFGPHTAKVVSTVTRLGYTIEDINMAVAKLKEADIAVTNDSLIEMSSEMQQESLEREVLKSCSGGTLERPGKDLHQDCDPDDADDDDDSDDNEEEQQKSSKKMEDVAGFVKQSTVGSKYKMREGEMNVRVKEAIEKRKESLRAAIEAMTFTCRLCHCAKATILLLPCGHLASCDDCLMDVRRCPIARCNKIVRGTKEVFFV